MDLFAMFLADCCVIGKQVKAKASELYRAYNQWCDHTGERPQNQRYFGMRLAERGFERYTNNGVWWRGIGLLDSERNERNERNEVSRNLLNKDTIGTFLNKGSVGSVGSVNHGLLKCQADDSIDSVPFPPMSEAKSLSIPVSFNCQACRHYSGLAHSCGDSGHYVVNTADPLCGGKRFQPLSGAIDHEQRA